MEKTLVQRIGALLSQCENTTEFLRALAEAQHNLSETGTPIDMSQDEVAQAIGKFADHIEEIEARTL